MTEKGSRVWLIDNKNNKKFDDDKAEVIDCKSKQLGVVHTGRRLLSLQVLIPAIILLLIVFVVVLIFTFHLNTEVEELQAKLDKFEALLNDAKIKHGNKFSKKNRKNGELYKKWNFDLEEFASARQEDGKAGGTEKFRYRRAESTVTEVTDHRKESPLDNSSSDSSVVRHRVRHAAEPERKRKNPKPKRTDRGKSAQKQSKYQAAHFQAHSVEARITTTNVQPQASDILTFFKPADWMNSTHQTFLTMRANGIVTVLEDGLYYIYAQIVYHDLNGRWAFGIFVNDRQVVKCINTEQIPDPDRLHPSNHGVYQHCYTSSLVKIQNLEQVTIRCLYGKSSIVMQPQFTFWGILQLI